MVSRLADAIVVRHHECSAAARMAAKSIVPVINAGDGWNEHPTQALIDIHAMRRGLGTLRGKSIAFGGDPRGRVVRSLIQLLRFEGPREIVFCPPPHYEVPEDLIIGACGVSDTAAHHRRYRHRIGRMRCGDDGAIRHVGHRRAAGFRLRLAPLHTEALRHHRGKDRAVRLSRAALSPVAALRRDRLVLRFDCPMPCISSRSAFRNSCAWRCWRGFSTPTEHNAASASDYDATLRRCCARCCGSFAASLPEAGNIGSMIRLRS